MINELSFDDHLGKLVVSKKGVVIVETCEAQMCFEGTITKKWDEGCGKQSYFSPLRPPVNYVNNHHFSVDFQFISSSTNLSRCNVLCCKEFLDDDVVQGNKRFLDAKNERLAIQILERVKTLGVNSRDEIEAHLHAIRIIEVRDD